MNLPELSEEQKRLLRDHYSEERARLETWTVGILREALAQAEARAKAATAERDVLRTELDRLREHLADEWRGEQATAPRAR
jgi:hypothetical protein